MDWSSALAAKWRFVPAALTAALVCAFTASCGRPDPVKERCGASNRGEVVDMGDRTGFFVLCKDGGVYWVKRHR